jgi:hypothetical protein
MIPTFSSAVSIVCLGYNLDKSGTEPAKDQKVKDELPTSRSIMASDLTRFLKETDAIAAHRLLEAVCLPRPATAVKRHPLLELKSETNPQELTSFLSQEAEESAAALRKRNPVLLVENVADLNGIHDTSPYTTDAMKMLTFFF